ncbi:hypothetical protein B0H14DRAFT_2619349 [Mycena olivaceomarginata]|nr:hypothetical protein B0H14DRAFT_2619349 [Mycena olivaceomarginata]
MYQHARGYQKTTPFMNEIKSGNPVLVVKDDSQTRPNIGHDSALLKVRVTKNHSRDGRNSINGLSFRGDHSLSVQLEGCLPKYFIEIDDEDTPPRKRGKRGPNSDTRLHFHEPAAITGDCGDKRWEFGCKHCKSDEARVECADAALLSELADEFADLTPLKKLRLITTKICSSPQRRRDFRLIAEDRYGDIMHAPGRKLASLMPVRDVKHRWNYTEAIVARARLLRASEVPQAPDRFLPSNPIPTKDTTRRLRSVVPRRWFFCRLGVGKFGYLCSVRITVVGEKWDVVSGPGETICLRSPVSETIAEDWGPEISDATSTTIGMALEVPGLRTSNSLVTPSRLQIPYSRNFPMVDAYLIKKGYLLVVVTKGRSSKMGMESASASGSTEGVTGASDMQAKDLACPPEAEVYREAQPPGEPSLAFSGRRCQIGLSAFPGSRLGAEEF